MRPVQPVFVHGWGFGPEFWAPVVAALGWTDALMLDLGFLEGPVPASPILAAQRLQAVQMQGRALLGVGHSLGFLWLAGHMALLPTDRLVGINAFAAFAARESFASGVPVRVLQRMLKGLSDTPEKVLADFYSLCGAPRTSMVPCVPSLRKGLDLLLAGDARPVLAAKAGHYGILAARHDPVATPAMTEESFAGCTAAQWVDGGHLLPQTHVSACAAFLQAARRTMEQDVK
ncbi:alpha/beta hydrolase [Acetobacter fabarum]|uniref:alpha/beta fold hydrolase n=1 Tax=Acetobacter fabarum TaxID=483199 RepID=UPI00312B6DD0